MVNSKLEESKRNLKSADHMLHVTYPVIKESKILLKVLEELGRSANLLIQFILENGKKEGRFKSYPDAKANFDSFSKNAHLYGLDESQILELKQLLGTMEGHKRSPMEFSRKEKFVIMSEEFQADILNVERLKKHIVLVKDMLKKVEKTLSK